MESGLNHLSIQPGEDGQVTVVKTFNVLVDFPFDISDKNFGIRYNDSMFSDTAAYDDYVYFVDSKLLAEFDNYVNCVRTKKQCRILEIQLALISMIFRRCLNA